MALPQVFLRSPQRQCSTAAAPAGSPFSSPDRATVPPNLAQQRLPALDARDKVSPPSFGKIDLIIGPMFAGKSTELLRRASSLQDANHRVALVSSCVDTRSGPSMIATHDGIKSEACAVSCLNDFLQHPLYAACNTVAIDEAQFFPDLLEFALHASEADGKNVIVAGLSGDFKRQKFGQLLELIPLADSITKLTSRCSCCTTQASPALFSLRVAANDSQTAVGGADMYVPVCRQHYVALFRKHA